MINIKKMMIYFLTVFSGIFLGLAISSCSGENNTASSNTNYTQSVALDKFSYSVYDADDKLVTSSATDKEYVLEKDELYSLEINLDLKVNSFPGEGNVTLYFDSDSSVFSGTVEEANTAFIEYLQYLNDSKIIKRFGLSYTNPTAYASYDLSTNFTYRFIPEADTSKIEDVVSLSFTDGSKNIKTDTSKKLLVAYKSISASESTKGYIIVVTDNFQNKQAYYLSEESNNYLDNCNHDGYLFKGIYSEPNGQGSQVFDENGFQTKGIAITSDSVLYSYYEAKTYTIKFNPGTGTLDSEETSRVLKAGDDVTAFPNAIPEENYYFAGYADAEGNLVSDGVTPIVSVFNSKYFVLAEDGIIELTAQYKPIEITITFDYNDRSDNAQTLAVRINSNYADIQLPVLESTSNKKFIGWSMKPLELYEYTGRVKTDLTLYAIWEYSKTVNFVYTENKTESVILTSTDKTYVFTDGILDGYTFLGWYDNDRFDYDFIASSSVYDTLDTYYGKFEITVYTISFVADGETVASEDFTVNSEITIAPELPEKTGYTGAWEEYTKELKNITVNAVYTPNTYMLVTDESSYEAVYESDFELYVPHIKGYDFLGWYYGDVQLTDGEGKSLAPYSYLESIYVTSEFERVGYTISFVTNGGNSIDSVHYDKDDSLLEFPEEPTKLGYFFDGWFNEDLTKEYEEGAVIEESLTLYAKWRKSNAIDSVEDLKNMQADVNYHLTKNINLAGEEWTPLDSYSGTFDGMGYKIYNFTITNNNASSAFIITNNGTIKNIHFEKVNFTDNFGDDSKNAAVVCDTNNGKISDVYVKDVSVTVSTVENTSGKSVYAGCVCAVNNGIVAKTKVTGTLTSSFSSSISTSGESGGSFVNYLEIGGIAGRNNGRILDSESSCTIASSTYGYIGYTASRWYPYGAYYNSLYHNAGGITGTNLGTVSNSKSSVTMTYVRTAGNYQGENKGTAVSAVSYDRFAGIAGWNDAAGIIDTCSSSGTISMDKTGNSATSGEYMAGGIAGYNSKGKVNNVSSCLNITVTNGNYNYVGGIVAFNSSGATVNNSQYFGELNVLSAQWTGGIVGGNDGLVNQCLSKASVNLNSSYTGGIVGNLASSGSVSNCICESNIAKIYGTSGGGNASKYEIDPDADFYNAESLYEDVCMINETYWSVNEGLGIYLTSFASHEHQYDDITCVTQMCTVENCGYQRAASSDHVFTEYTVDAADNTKETALCDNGCGTTDTRDTE